ncbi:MAG: hypothetical protein IJV67_01375 [Clostridia bacterium]|nr:hypothetical protein [Clostridia bacterium]
MRNKGLLIFLLAFVLLFVSCKGTGNTGTGSGGGLPDYDTKKDELSVDIMGWVTPVSMNDEQLGYIVESGVGALFYMTNTYSPSNEVFNELELCKNYGIDIYISSGAKDGSVVGNIENFNNCDAVIGMTIDEPNKDGITSIASAVEGFNSVSNGKSLFVNLYPSFANAVNKFSGGYEEYLRYYCESVLEKLTVGEKWLSADRYPLIYNTKGEKDLDSGWLYDIETVATVARDYKDVKSNFFIHTMPYGSGTGSGSRNRVPTYEDIRMQEYTLMAFGYDAISLFCYGTPNVGPEFSDEQVAMIDRSGNRTDIYYAAQRANKEILAFDHVLKQFSWKGVFTNDAGKTTVDKDRTTNSSFSNLINRMSLEQVSFIDEVYSSEDTLFGYFMDEEDNEAVMLVNYNETTKEKKDDVKITFNSQYKYNKCLCYVGGEKKVFDVVDNTLQITLGVGEGVFAIPYRQ